MKDSLVSRDKKMLPNWPPKPSDGSGIKVLFINPPAVPFDLVEKLISGQKINLYQTVAMPMGILYLSSVLENALPGIEIRIIDDRHSALGVCDSLRYLIPANQSSQAVGCADNINN